MSELPKGWKTAKIPDLIGADGVFNDGDWVESKDQDPDGDVRLVQLADIGDGEFRDRSNRFMTSEKAEKLRCTFMKKGDVLVARMPDPLGRACIFPGDKKKSVTVVDVCIIRPGKDSVDPRWLMNHINAPQFRAAIDSYESGTTRKRISRKNLSRIEFPLPPLPEQRRIVARIEELFSHLDAGVVALRHAKAQLQRYRQSVLAAAVTGELTQAWREQHPDTEPTEELLDRILKQRRAQWNGRGKYKEPVSIELNDEGPQPATWTTTNLDSATTMLGDGLHGTPEYDPEGEFYFINGNNLSNGRIIFKDSTKRVSESEYRKHSKQLTENSIFVSINGTLGNTAFYSGEKVILGKSACFFNLSSALSKHYVRTVLQTTRFLNYLHKTATGSTIKNVPLQAMRNFSFGIPPLAEQHQIVAEVEARTTAIDHLEAELDRQITRSNRLRQSTLAAAFSGKLAQKTTTE